MPCSRATGCQCARRWAADLWLMSAAVANRCFAAPRCDTKPRQRVAATSLRLHASSLHAVPPAGAAPLLLTQAPQPELEAATGAASAPALPAAAPGRRGRRKGADKENQPPADDGKAADNKPAPKRRGASKKAATAAAAADPPAPADGAPKPAAAEPSGACLARTLVVRRVSVRYCCSDACQSLVSAGQRMTGEHVRLLNDYPTHAKLAESG